MAPSLWSPRSRAAAVDYRALVVLVLAGGVDGHHMLVPLDAGYGDYQRSRTSLAMVKSSLVPLSGKVSGRSFGLHPALGAWAPLYAAGRLAFVANAGPLIQPVTAAQVMAGTAPVPMFLMSHYDQALLQQGRDPLIHLSSGWAGRGVEALPRELHNPLAAMDLSLGSVVARGPSTLPAALRTGYVNWAWLDFSDPHSRGTLTLRQLAANQSTNAYQAQYLRTFQAALEADLLQSRLIPRAVTPTQDFGGSQLGDHLRQLASMLPVFVAEGFRRQVFAVNWGRFDTHDGQRGTGQYAHDTQFADLAQAVAAFDAAVHMHGLGENVTVLMLTDFGRTLRTSSGGGSEHAWGTHLFALGGAVAGGTVHGIFPDLTLGGPDDFDVDKGGRHVPTTSTDQVAASVLRWLGVPAERLNDIVPYLHHFASPTIALMRA